MSYMLILAAITLFLMVVVRFLNLQNLPAVPQLFFKDQKFVEVLAKHCPAIYDAYIPTPLWGLSGHIQTIVHAVVGRVRTRHCQSVRRTTRLGDGATLTWDEWTPVDHHPDPGDYTLAVCPGIGNSSETVYIWSFVHYAALHGYRCIVLNHLGALRSVKLTSPRIFGYGRTEEFDVMLRQHLQRYPHTRLVLVGFSMGGNIVTKYMGLSENARPSAILGAISICQGYDAQRCLNSMMPWSQLRRLYLLMMTENVKKVILRHRSVLLSDEVRAKHHLDERKIFMAATLCDLDEAYTRRVNGYDSLDDFYDDNSSSSYIPSIRQPMVFINSLDDPLVPPAALRCVQQHCSSHEETLLIETEHGGHLGFFEGRFIIPEPVTWLDRTVVQLAHGLVAHAAMSS